MPRPTLRAIAPLLALSSAALLTAADRTADRPAIVLLLADDLGYGEIPGTGADRVPTPHIDSLMRQGVRFSAGYVTASYCSPSRAGLLTGRYPSRFGYELNPVGPRNEDPRVGLPRTEVTLARHLRNAGYSTSLVGKWHLGGSAEQHPQRRGFDEFFGFLHEGHFYVPPPWRGVTTMLRRRALPDGTRGRWRRGNLVYSTHMGHDEPAYDASNPILRGGQPVEETAYLTDALTREAVDFIGRHAGEPFFLYLAYNAVHSPLQGAAAYMRRFSHLDVHRQIFAAMLANLDDSVGRVLRKLEEERISENTLVFFVSDNGGPTRELTSSNRPLRGGKGDLYEGGIRVPFALRWPGRVPAGEVYPHPVISLDVYATCAAAAGASPGPDRSLDGVDLIPYVTGERSGRPHDRLFWRMGAKAAVRAGDWKLVRSSRRRDAPWELYDLSRDTEERQDLASRLPDRRRALVEIWTRWSGELPEPTRLDAR